MLLKKKNLYISTIIMVHREYWHDHQGHRLPGDPGATSGGLSHGALVGTVPLGSAAKLGGQTGCTHWSQEGGTNAERMPRVIFQSHWGRVVALGCWLWHIYHHLLNYKLKVGNSTVRCSDPPPEYTGFLYKEHMSRCLKWCSQATTMRISKMKHPIV